MTNETKQEENLNKIKHKLFGNLEVNVIKDPENPEKVTFERVMHKFERANIYIKYSFKYNEINQIYQNFKNKVKIIYNREQ